MEVRRKRVAPEFFQHVPNSLPSFCWWGIACGQRNGVPLHALKHDLEQLETHSPYLADRWRELTPLRKRLGTKAGDVGRVAAGEVAMEFVSNGLAAVLDHSVPGLGLVRWLAGETKDAVADRQDRRERFSGSDAVGPDRAPVIDRTVSLLAGLGSGGVPVVLFVEDVHLADEPLCQVLQGLVTGPGAVMVVTTGWPGNAADNQPLSAAVAQAKARERFVEVGVESVAGFSG